MTASRLHYLMLLASLWLNTSVTVGDAPSFNRDIAPILAAKCYECHGPDAEQREAGLRLDDEQSAKAKLESGFAAIVNGRADDSELVRRIRSTGEDRMPPADAGEPLSPDEVNRITAWIDSGATWQGHWAFEPLDRRAVPQTQDRQWPRNAIDRFVLHRLEQNDLTPATMADRYTLIRRIYFDLLGLPPTPDAITAFVNDKRPDAWTHLVDELLASPHYGERWGRHWLDVARYGDSNGGDENHSYPLAHRYRDYVIDVTPAMTCRMTSSSNNNWLVIYSTGPTTSGSMPCS